MNEIAIPGLVKATLAQHAAQARVEYERTVKALDGRALLTSTAKHLRVRRDRLEAEYKAWEHLLRTVSEPDTPICTRSPDCHRPEGHADDCALEYGR